MTIKDEQKQAETIGFLNMNGGQLQAELIGGATITNGTASANKTG